MRNILTFLFVAVFSIGVALAQTTVTLTGSGTWTVPAGVTSITVKCWGGGGAGGGSTANNSGGSGGGGGGYCERTISSLSGGEGFTYAVGSAGTGSTGNGTAGTSSTFINAGLLINMSANGGGGGGFNKGLIGAGGNASGGTTNTTGGPGTLGGNAGGNGGDGANGGVGGVGAKNVAGALGSAPGGGGAGAEYDASSLAGGNGGAGSITITYALPGDNCSNAMDLSSLTSPYSSTTVGYADDISTCHTGAPDRVFYLSVPNCNTVDIYESTNGYDEYEYLGYGPSCASLTEIKCWDNDALAHNTWTNATGSAQTVWYIQDGLSGGSGTFTLNWTVTAGATIAAPTAGTHTTTPTQITWNWNTVTSATGYKWSTTNNYATATDLGNVTTVTQTGFTCGTSHTIYVWAYNSCGNSTATTLTTSTAACPPANDACASATALPCGTVNLAGTTAGAVAETAGTGCTMSDYGVWYTFTGTGYANTISVTTTSFDVEMAIASGTCGSLTNITCEDDAMSSGTETYTFTTTLGTTYYVYVGYYGTGTTTGTFTISRSCETPCAGAPNNGTAAASPTSLGCSITSTSLSASGLSSGGGITYQWQSSPNNSTWTNISGATSTTYTASPASTTYYQIVSYCPASNQYGYSTSVLVTVNTTPPVNDACANAAALPCATTNMAGTTNCAVSETAPGSCASSYGVWYTFTGTGYATTISSTATFDHEMDFFSGTCASLTNITCLDGAGSGSSESYTFNTVLGTTYYIYLAHYSTSSTVTGTFTISRDCETPCSGAPNAGVASASPAVIGCSSSTTTLSASGLSAGGGITYQWQSSPNNSAWTNISGATSNSYVASPTADTYYRIVSYCPASLQFGYSSSVFVTYAATPPGNNECAGSVLLTVNPDYNCGTVTHGTTECATQSLAGCAGTADDDVWYRFVATATSHKISLLNISGTTDLVFQVFSGNCGSLTSLLCSDPQSASVTGLTIGATYYVRVYTYSSGSSYTAGFDICIGTPPPPPSNDEACGATVLPVNAPNTCANSASGTVAGATASAAGNTCSSTYDDDDVWFSFVAQGTTHNVNIYNISGSYTSMYFAVYNGACGSPSQVSCFYDETGTLTGLTNGSTYYVRVYTATSTGDQTTSFNICTFPLACATNDECSSATALTVNPTSACASVTGGTVNCATASAQSTACTSGNDDDDVWYSFVATGATHSVSLLNVVGSVSDMYFAVYSGNCASLTSLVCSDANTQVVGGLTAGNTYYVRVYTYGSTATTTTFDICISSPDPDALCGTAKPFCSDTTYNFPTNVNSGTAAAGINYGCLCQQPNPIWYYMKIGTAGPIELTIQSSCGDVDYAAWGPFSTQTCDSLTNSGTFDYGSSTSTSCAVDNFESPSGNMIDCAYSTASIEYLSIANSQVNKYYLIMINNYSNCSGMYTFHQTSGAGKTDCIIVALPVGLYSLSSNCVSENEVQLEWTTFTQYNNDYFEVQRMINGEFVTIGIVDGAGNSNELLKYTFVDFVNTSDVQYYRLRQVDFDGKSSDLKTIPVDCNGDLAFGINSASLDANSGNLEINFNGLTDQEYQINLMDLSGKVIFSDSYIAANDGKNQAVSYFKPVAQGVYVVSLTNKSGITKFSKVSPR